MHHAHNGPGIDRVLGEIKRDGASKEGSRAEQGRHFDSVLRFVITVQNAKVIVAIAVEERTARCGERCNCRPPASLFYGMDIPKITEINYLYRKPNRYVSPPNLTFPLPIVLLSNDFCILHLIFIHPSTPL